MNNPTSDSIIIGALFYVACDTLKRSEVFKEGSEYEAEWLNSALEAALEGGWVLTGTAHEWPVLFRDNLWQIQ